MIKTASQMGVAHKTIKDLVQDLTDATTQGDTASRVEAGSILWSLAEESKKALDDLKAHLREAAVKAVGPGGTESFNGLLQGSAKVVVPGQSVKTRKGVDIDDLKAHPSFSDVFQEVTTYKARRNAGEVVADLPHGSERDAMLGSLDIVNGTPRVSFTRTGG